MQDVLISFRSLHDCGTDNEDSIEFTTDGLYSFDGRVSCLTYMESEVTGMEGTRTSVIVMPDKVVLDRDGVITSRMIFQPGQRNSMLYDTPYGTATLSIDTRRITHSFDENGGNMEIDYILGVEHAVVSKNRFSLDVSKQKGDRSYV